MILGSRDRLRCCTNRKGKRSNVPQRDHLALRDVGTCVKCAQRPRRDGHPLWCGPCATKAQKQGGRRRRLTLASLQTVIDDLSPKETP